MFDFDNFREIWSTMRKNKLRTFLTGFAVAWGIFMLIVLLGAGNGLSNGISSNFKNYSINMVELWGRYTTLPYQGLPTNRWIRLTEKDVEALKREHPEIDLITPINYRTETISYNQEFLSGQIRAVYPDYASINYVPILPGKGRFINALDMRDRRKVIVITPHIATVLFRDSVEPVGQFVKIGNLMFQVIGIYKNENTSDHSPAFVPFSTGLLLFERGYRIGNIDFTINGVNTEAKTEAFQQRVRERLARRHRFNPEDRNAVGMFDLGQNFRMWEGMTNGIALFIWIVGIGTLMAGIVGVSNIMLITVRERKREFGIRKAIGAKPSSILKLIIVESVMVTAAFGYIGMLSGIGLTELINYIMEMTMQGGRAADNDAQLGSTLFLNPTVNLGISLSATGVLILSGVLAGYFPARKAVKITAIEAMREE
ncbi:MAG: ABC transporter permease [Bacteroidales bacterium]